MQVGEGNEVRYVEIWGGSGVLLSLKMLHIDPL
jgi:hypothetical protein